MRHKDDEKQNSIKKAVVKIVLEQGMHGTSISKIAKAAGVSPATVYIYYENKDVMLRDIYHEYAEEVFNSLLKQLDETMSGELLIDKIIREYHHYMMVNEEIFHFVEQFSSCPSLNQGCMSISGPDRLDALLIHYKEMDILRNYDNSNIWAMLFYPIKGIAKKSCNPNMTKEQQLDEMIQIIQHALLL